MQGRECHLILHLGPTKLDLNFLSIHKLQLYISVQSFQNGNYRMRYLRFMEILHYTTSNGIKGLFKVQKCYEERLRYLSL